MQGHDPNLVYDVGAHKGEDTDFYLKKGFSVVAIEAHPDLARLVASRFPEYIRSGRLTVVSAAIAPTAGTIEFFANEKHSVWGTTNPDWAERNKRKRAMSVMREVPAVTFDSVLAEHGIPYYLKVDIEGADVLCLLALQKLSGRPKYISIESSLSNWQALIDEFELFRSFGYHRFKIIDQATVHHQSPPVPASEGRDTVHTFEKGSTGLFGSELPGEWMPQSEAIAIYRALAARERRFGDDTLARKIVKRTPLLRSFRHRILPSWYDTHARYGS